ncbi:helix-turn-helix domain-containing protein [Roseateles chitinivorans]|uniref:helix-turn-helix domain-containing protein n=1 Tax=Roseateles chitinivorans TaxID=2917965 RepID=UPI003D66BF72
MTPPPPTMVPDPDDLSPAAIDEWIRRAYQPHGRLSDLLNGLATSLMNRWPLRALELSIDDQGEWLAQREAGRLHVEWRPAVTASQAVISKAAVSEEKQAEQAAPAQAAMQDEHRSDTLPVVHAGLPLGRLTLAWQAGLPETPTTAPALRHLCAWLGRLCHRHRVEDWAHAAQRPIRLLIGTSAALARLECFVERAAQSDLPVLLQGEFGTEKAWAAAAIHAGGRRRSGPLVEVHCAHPPDGPAAWLQQARGGTLFLHGVDELSPPLQTELLGQWLTAQQAWRAENAAAGGLPGSVPGVRLIASTTADLRHPGGVPVVSRALHAELDYLSAELPALRARPGDIPLLLEAALGRSLPAAEPAQIDAALAAACQAYDWPGNVAELDRAMACLTTMAEAAVIGLEELRRYTPWLLPPAGDAAGDRAGRPGAGPEEIAGRAEDVVPDAVPASVGSASAQAVPPGSGPLRPLAPSTATGLTAAPRSASQWVGIVLERQVRVLDTVHPGLRRALLFLSEHFAEPVSLTDLAAQAHVSASHLTFLFRSSLGMSFKSFLLCIRIHIAQQLLREPQLRITEVALRAGFADLSHFERCFRRAVGRSARDHRRAMSAGE